MESISVIEHMNACILVVEDDPNHMELIVEAIKEDNVFSKILCVEDGIKALRYLKREGEYTDEEKYPRPALILLDLKLPGMDGKIVLKLIKSNVEIQSIPVIILTSSAQDDDIKECYDLGANSYVTKPISSGDFYKKVNAIPSYWLSVNRLPSL